MMLVISLSYMAFIMLMYVPSISSFIRALIMKRCWYLSKAFCVSIEVIKCFLSLFLLVFYFTFNDLCMLNHPCICGMKQTWSWCMIFWIFCWIWFGNILLRIFASKFIKEIGL
jgi:hypothetical protein